MKKFNIDFCGNTKRFLTFSLALLAIGFICNIIFGTQLDIQFKGGAMIKYSYSGAVVQEDVEKIVQESTNKDVTVRIHEDAAGMGVSTLSITFAGAESISVDQQQQIASALEKQYADANFSVVESSSINPSMGANFFLKCICAIIITAILLIIYVAFRFKKIGGLSAGVMAVISLFHDVLMIYFTFVIFRIPINDSFIAVVLTILGYSLNNTIIIYDRIRENRRLLGPRAGYAELVNSSINQTLTRSINTSLCTFLAVAVVYVVGMIFGLSTVTTFALPMLVGILFGCYSSVCISGPLYVAWQEYRAKKKNSSGPAVEAK